uniref:Cystatin domain-containing protein n=2 Tax=Gasterosteus aculeatus TaxID=69293 RepID=A0AAQ4QMB4_GASAC|nr:cystatin-C-like [Gasterosteus aculeatus aculeatus]
MMWKLVFVIIAAVSFIGLAQIPGGFTDISINDEGAKEALDFAVLIHNRHSNDFYIRVVTDVIKVQVQVVAGSQYLITVRMARTPCRKYDANDVCAPDPDPAWAQPYQCIFTVWSRPWINDVRLTNQEC